MNQNTQSRRGGKRAGAGKKALYEKRMPRVNITLDEESAKILKKFGNGNLSAGIRLAAKILDQLANGIAE